MQESLTNVIKHSAASTATVTIEATGAEVDIEVVDPGPLRPTSGVRSGHGLVGLVERVQLVGGTVEYGALGSGFRVHATLPAVAGR